MQLGFDSCGHFNGKDIVLACYMKHIICGHDICNKGNICLTTIKDYIKKVNTLHELHGVDTPVPTFMDCTNTISILIWNLQNEENITRRWNPLTDQMAWYLIQEGTSTDPLSITSLVANIIVLAHEVGLCAAEFAQTKKYKAEVCIYPCIKRL